MKYKGIELASYPICDTDIWVDAVLAGLDGALIKKYDKIIVADVVEKEIRKFRKSQVAQRIAQNFQIYKKEKKIIVIRHDDIEERDRRLLEKQLVDCDNRFISGLSDDPHEQHKGEIVSAIYAEYFELPFLKSNDSAFREGEMGRIAFPDLVVKNLDDMLNDLVEDKKKRCEYRKKINSYQAIMREEKRMYQEKKIEEGKKMQEGGISVPATNESIALLLRKWKGGN